MFYSKGALPKRQLGPALQWAKQRSDSAQPILGRHLDDERSHSGLPFVRQTPEVSSATTSQTPTTSADSHGLTPLADETLPAGDESTPQAPSIFQQPDFLQPYNPREIPSKEESAWNFYRGDRTETYRDGIADDYSPYAVHHERFQTTPDIYDPSRDELSEHDGIYPDDHGVNIRSDRPKETIKIGQLLFPIGVVGFMLLIGFLTMLS